MGQVLDVERIVERAEERSKELVTSGSGDNRELVTSEQMAKERGIAKRTMDERLQQYGIEPDVPSKPGLYGTPAYYDKAKVIRAESTATNLEVAGDSSRIADKLLTVVEMAERCGVSDDTMLRRIKKFGITPDVPFAPGLRGHADLYATSTLNQIVAMEAAVQNELEEERLAAQVAKTDPKVKEGILAEAIENLRNDTSQGATDAIMANALGFMQMLYERLHLQEKVIEEERLRVKGWKEETASYVHSNVGNRQQVRDDMNTHEKHVEIYVRQHTRKE